MNVIQRSLNIGKIFVRNFFTEKLILVYLLLLAFVLRFVFIGGPFGGFHGWNEAHYSLTALNFDKTSFFYPMSYSSFPGKYVFNVPPLFSYSEYLFFKLVGFSELNSRIIPTALGFLSVLLVYFLAKELYNRKVALLSAFFLSFAPMHVLISRNVQTDIPFTFFLILSFYIFIRGYNRKDKFLIITSGLMAGIAAWLKQPGLVFVPLVLLYYFLIDRKKELVKPLVASCILSIIVVLPWFLYHTIYDPEAFWKVQFMEVSGKTANWFPVERIARVLTFGIHDGLTPIVALLSFLGIVMYWKNGKFLLLWILIFVPFLLRTPGGHEYYVLPIFPPLVVFAGLVAYDLSKKYKNYFGFFILFIVFSGIFLTFIELHYRDTSDYFKRLGNFFDDKPKDALVLYNTYPPLVEFYVKRETKLFNVSLLNSGRETYVIATNLKDKGNFEKNFSIVYEITGDKKILSDPSHIWVFKAS